MMVFGCGDDDDDNGGGGSAFIGETLTLSEQVWTVSWDNNDNPKFEEFKGNRTGLSASFRGVDIGGSGSITNGQLSFSIGTPSELETVQEYFGEWSDAFNNFNISPSNAGIAILSINIGNTGSLYKEWFNYYDEEEVDYIYVDRDVTITGSAKTTKYECDCSNCDCADWDGDCYCDGSFITRNLNLNLKAGWNVITSKFEWNESNNTETATVSAGDSSRARWILQEWGGGGYNMSISNFAESSENVKSNNNLRSLIGSRR